MSEAEAHAAIQEARLKVKAGRSFVRDLAATLARAEQALDYLNAQPKEAQRDHDRDLERVA